MAFPLNSVLIPVDFDGSATRSLAFAKALLENATRSTIHLVHVVTPTATPSEPIANVSGLGDQAQRQLAELAAEQLRGVRHQIIVRTGDVVREIVEAARAVQADLILMPTHGRRGFSRLFLGSVTERVVRDAPCPVLTLKPETLVPVTKVEDVMVTAPAVVEPEASLAQAAKVMEQSGARSLPVLDHERLVGIITDRDLRSRLRELETTPVKAAMATKLHTIAPYTPVSEAARLLLELKIGALPVVDKNKLVGLVSTDDVITAWVERPAEQ